MRKPMIAAGAIALAAAGAAVCGGGSSSTLHGTFTDYVGNDPTTGSSPGQAATGWVRSRTSKDRRTPCDTGRPPGDHAVGGWGWRIPLSHPIAQQGQPAT
jgi:hypothetical protein